MDSSTTSNTKGIKYQSYKIAHDLISSYKECNEAIIYFAIEFYDDGTKIDFTKSEHVIEQAKNYTSNFSINSVEVKKAIKNFYHYYTKFPEDKGLAFVFYTNTSTKGTQKPTKIINKEEVSYLDEHGLNFMEVLANSENIIKHKHVVVSVVKRIIGLDEIEEETVLEFLTKVRWIFHYGDINDLKSTAIDLIKDLPEYNYEYKDKEEIIFTQLVELIESRSLGTGFNKTVDHRDIINIFKSIRLNQFKFEDDASIEFLGTRKRSERNIRDKLNDVSKGFTQHYFNVLERNITRGKSDHSRLPEKEVNTLMFRIYEKCESELIDSKGLFFNSFKDYKEFQEELAKTVHEYMLDRSTDFRYGLISKDNVSNTIQILFNECYLEFNIKDEDVNSENECV